MKIEIKRVAKNWEHPRDAGGNYIPLYLGNYEEDLNRWIYYYLLWSRGIHPELKKKKRGVKQPVHFAQFAGNPPRIQDYRHESFSAGKDEGFQLYSTLRKSVPLSPVFDSLEELKEYILSKIQGITYTKLSAIIDQLEVEKNTSKPRRGATPLRFPPRGKEQFEATYSSVTKQVYIDYTYRHTDGSLFTTSGKSLVECRQEKESWLSDKKGNKSGKKKELAKI